MKLSNEGRLIVAMLASIQRKLCITEDHDAVDPDFVLAAIYQRQQWAIPVRYTGLFEAEATPPNVGTVLDHLSMWVELERCFDALSQPDQVRVTAAAEQGRMQIRFPGYDAKQESDYLGITRFVIEYMQSYPTLAERPDYVAGRPMAAHYDAMMRTYRDECASTGAGALAPEQLIKVLNAAH